MITVTHHECEGVHLRQCIDILLKLFLRTQKVERCDSIHLVKNSVFHDEKSWEYIEGLYSKQWKKKDHRPNATLSSKLNFLTRKEFVEYVGMFLRDLDYLVANIYRMRMQGAGTYVCSILAIKRWVDFDVRELRRNGCAEEILQVLHGTGALYDIQSVF